MFEHKQWRLIPRTQCPDNDSDHGNKGGHRSRLKGLRSLVSRWTRLGGSFSELNLCYSTRSTKKIVHIDPVFSGQNTTDTQYLSWGGGGESERERYTHKNYTNIHTYRDTVDLPLCLLVVLSNISMASSTCKTQENSGF